MSQTQTANTEKIFLNFKVENKIEYSIKDTEVLKRSGKESTFKHKGVEFHLGVGGEFNILNALASIKLAETLGIDIGVSKETLSSNKKVRGRMEHIETEKDFDAVVDYARVRFIKKTLQSIQKETQGMHSWEHRRGKR